MEYKNFKLTKTSDSLGISCLCKINNELIGIGVETEVVLFSFPKFSVIQKYKGHIGNIVYIVFHKSSSHLLSSSKDKTLNIWNYIEHTLLHSIKLNAICTSIVELPNGNIITSSLDDNLSLWELDNLSCYQTIYKVNYMVNNQGMLLWKDGRFVNMGQYLTLQVWSLTSDYSLENINSYVKIFYSVSSLFQAKNEDLLIGTNFGFLLVYDVQDFLIKMTIESDANSILSLGMLDNGLVFSSSISQTINIWNLSQKKVEETIVWKEKLSSFPKIIAWENSFIMGEKKLFLYTSK